LKEHIANSDKIMEAQEIIIEFQKEMIDNFKLNHKELMNKMGLVPSLV